MTVRVPKQNKTPHARRIPCAAGIMVASSLLVGVTQVSAQDVAEAARQNRANKNTQQKKTKHVYTEHDLQQAKILTPEDQAVVDAKKQQNETAPGTPAPQTLDAKKDAVDETTTPTATVAPEAAKNLDGISLDSAPAVTAAEEAAEATPTTPAISDTTFADAHVSLGEVARAYRKQKELTAQSKNFHLPFSEQPVLATPKALPMMVASPKKPAVAPEQFQLRKPMSAPTEKAPAIHPTLRSPFGRPALTMPANSEISANRLNPAKPHNFATPRVAPNVPHSSLAAPAAPQLTVKKAAPAVANLAPIQTVAKPKPILHLNAATAPNVRSQVSVASVAPKLRDAQIAASAPQLSVPASVVAPAEVSVASEPAAIAPTAKKSFAAATPVAPTLPVARSKKSVVVAPILNLVAPKSIAVNPTMVAPSAVATAVANPTITNPLAGLATITVQVGDSLWTLAQKNLGNGARWHDLVAVNPAITNPNHIIAGTMLALPTGASVSQKTNSPEVTKITIKKGDTLWAIAQARFGHAEYWNCIAAHNPTLKNPHRIFAQQEIFLPASCGK